MKDLEETLSQVRERHAAATPGPWRWMGYVRGRGTDAHVRGSKNEKRRTDNLWLATTHSGALFIMDFVRAGFSGAEPRFQITGDVSIEVDGQQMFPGRMYGAGEWVDSYKTYSGQMKGGINNPNATAIERSWEDVEFLLGEIDRLRALLTEREPANV